MEITFTEKAAHCYTPHKIVSATVTPDGEMHVVRQFPSNMRYADYDGTPVPDKVVKEIYRCEGGQIVLAATIIGTHKPAYRVEERIEF